MSRKNAILMLLFAGVLWSLGGLLIKSIPWHPLAISGLRGGIAAIVIYSYSKDRKIIITYEKLFAACFYTSRAPVRYLHFAPSSNRCVVMTRQVVFNRFDL